MKIKKGNWEEWQITRNIDEQYGIYAFRKWSEKEVAQWIYANYPCSKYMAKKIAPQYCRRDYVDR